MKMKKTFKSAVVAALTLALLAAIPLTFALAEDGESAIDDVVIDDVLLDDAVIDDVEDEAADDVEITTFTTLSECPYCGGTNFRHTPWGWWQGEFIHEVFCNDCDVFLEDEECIDNGSGECTLCGATIPDCVTNGHTRPAASRIYGNWWYNDVLSHSYNCAVCDLWIPEPCTFPADPVIDVTECAICSGTYKELCATHTWSAYWNFLSWDDTVWHERVCEVCNYYEQDACTYSGGTVCTVCGYDARVCLTCNGQGSFTCGVSEDRWGNTWRCGYDGIECGSFVWLDLENDIQMGYCDCGCSTAAGALEHAESEDYLEYYEPGDRFVYGCHDDCSCVVDCPDCEPLRRSSPLAPRMGEDSALLTWVIVPMALLFVAGPVEMVISRRKAKNTNK